ncbi:MAG: hypothetical protein IRY90_10225 [Actinomadura rubrobrunea]|nr:hypothetical protein [Actinomadura rubrobrunea]
MDTTTVLDTANGVLQAASLVLSILVQVRHRRCPHCADNRPGTQPGTDNGHTCAHDDDDDPNESGPSVKK